MDTEALAEPEDLTVWVVAVLGLTVGEVPYCRYLVLPASAWARMTSACSLASSTISTRRFWPRINGSLLSAIGREDPAPW
ncbi:hypothetical protein D3C72_1795050 [compost metagenome]